MVVVVKAALLVVELVRQFLGVVCGQGSLPGGFRGPFGLVLGSPGPPSRPPARSPGLISQPLSLIAVGLVSPVPGQVGGLLSRVGGVLRQLSRLLRLLGALLKP